MIVIAAGQALQRIANTPAKEICVLVCVLIYLGFFYFFGGKSK
jgi:hypothetical protein